MDTKSWRKFFNINPEAVLKTRDELRRMAAAARQDQTIFEILDDMERGCPVCGKSSPLEGMSVHLAEETDERHKAYAAARDVVRA